MRVVVTTCTAVYAGRGDTTLPRARRAIIIKEDGAIAIHSDSSNKPLNYMGKGCVHLDTKTDSGETFWVFENRKENLQITLHEIHSDTAYELEAEEPGLTRDGTEPQLQAWLAEHPEALGDAGFHSAEREFPTGAGAVDLLVRDASGRPYAVEVKRVAMLGAVDQAVRYVEALQSLYGFTEVIPMVAALDIRPNTVKYALRKGVTCVELPKDWRATSADSTAQQPSSEDPPAASAGE